MSKNACRYSTLFNKGAQEELRQEAGRRREGQGGDIEEDQAGVRRKAEAEGDRSYEEGEGNRSENKVGTVIHGAAATRGQGFVDFLFAPFGTLTKLVLAQLVREENLQWLV